MSDAIAELKDIAKYLRRVKLADLGTEELRYELQRHVVLAGEQLINLFHEGVITAEQIPWVRPPKEEASKSAAVTGVAKKTGDPEAEWESQKEKYVTLLTRRLQIYYERAKAPKTVKGLPFDSKHLYAASVVDLLIIYWLEKDGLQEVPTFRISSGSIEDLLEYGHFGAYIEVIPKGSKAADLPSRFVQDDTIPLPMCFQEGRLIPNLDGVGTTRVLLDVYRQAVSMLAAWLEGCQLDGKPNSDTHPGITVPSPDGWTRSELVAQAREGAGSFSPTTFDRIRVAAKVEPGKAGGEGQKRRFSIAELTKLINAVENGTFRYKADIAKSWRKLLPQSPSNESPLNPQ